MTDKIDQEIIIEDKNEQDQSFNNSNYMAKSQVSENYNQPSPVQTFSYQIPDKAQEFYTSNEQFSNQTQVKQKQQDQEEFKQEIRYQQFPVSTQQATAKVEQKTIKTGYENQISVSQQQQQQTSSSQIRQGENKLQHQYNQTMPLFNQQQQMATNNQYQNLSQTFGHSNNFYGHQHHNHGHSHGHHQHIHHGHSYSQTQIVSPQHQIRQVITQSPVREVVDNQPVQEIIKTSVKCDCHKIIKKQDERILWLEKELQKRKNVQITTQNDQNYKEELKLQESRIVSLQKTLNESNESQTHYQKLLGKEQTDNEKLTHSILQKEKQVASLELKIKEITHADDINKYKDENLIKLSQQIGILEETIDKLKIDLEFKDNAIKVKDSENNFFKGKWERKKKKHSNLKSIYTKNQVTLQDKYEAEIQQKKDEEMKLQIKIKQLEEDKLKFQNEINSIKFQVEKYEKSQNNHQNKIFACQEEVKQIKQSTQLQISQIQNQNKAENHDLKEIIGSKEIEIVNLSNNIVLLQKQLRELSEKLNYFQSTHESHYHNQYVQPVVEKQSIREVPVFQQPMMPVQVPVIQSFQHQYPIIKQSLPLMNRDINSSYSEIKTTVQKGKQPSQQVTTHNNSPIKVQEHFESNQKQQNQVRFHIENVDQHDRFSGREAQFQSENDKIFVQTKNK